MDLLKKKRKNGSKYLVFDSTDERKKEVLKKYTELWDGIKLCNNKCKWRWLKIFMLNMTEKDVNPMNYKNVAV